MSLGRQTPQGSYYDRYNRPTASLYRARQPYLVKNALTGLGIFAFVIGVYSFTIKAVAQDDFEDVVVPDTPRQPATQQPQMLSAAGPAPGVNKK
ncbi:hypothetical protein AAFC00_002817 [Neodothiora populina]|uniref:Cytochrome c oxidase assembly factor 3 n=1 Tax=Neodothiora populina TaxID=2781224 RepID=A0ABR3P8I4_9PEZI